MTTLSKPKHYEQQWLNMKPVPGGRLCGQCTKTIVEISKMRWQEIEKLQAVNGNRLCGMYTSKQLVHWGNEVPDLSECMGKAAAIVGLFTSISVSALGQKQVEVITDTIVVEGKVLDRVNLAKS